MNNFSVGFLNFFNTSSNFLNNEDIGFTFAFIFFFIGLLLITALIAFLIKKIVEVQDERD